MDPEINKIKFDVNNSKPHDLIAYIMVRFAQDLIYFPFQGNRTLNNESVTKAIRLNSYMKPYKKKFDYNKNFYIDNTRISPVNFTGNNSNVYTYFYDLVNSSKYINSVIKLYDKNIYDWANEYRYKTNYHPLTHHYALLIIIKILEKLLSNEKS